MSAKRGVTIDVLHLRKHKGQILALKNLLAGEIKGASDRAVLARYPISRDIANTLRQRVILDWDVQFRRQTAE